MSTELVTISNRRPTILGGQAGLRLMPGKNKVSMEVYEANRVIDAFQAWCRLGWVAVTLPASQAAAARLDAGSEPDGAEALDNLNSPQAQALVKTTTSVELLDAWYSRDDRVTVQRAIKAQLEELQAPSEDEGSDEDEGGTDPADMGPGELDGYHGAESETEG